MKHRKEQKRHVVHHCIIISQFLLSIIQSLFGDDRIYISSNQTSPTAGFNRLSVKESTTGELWRVVENILGEFRFFSPVDVSKINVSITDSNNVNH